jgi:hypothetical protein
MAECINRKAAISLIKQYAHDAIDGGRYSLDTVDDCIEPAKHIETLPTADVAPVVHGWWESVDSSYWRWTSSGAVSVSHITYRCGRCGRGTVVKTSYCPNCGAKMDGGEKSG